MSRGPRRMTLQLTQGAAGGASGIFAQQNQHRTNQSARERAQQSAGRGNRSDDTKARSSVLEEGDRVLVRNMTPRGGTGKLRTHWQDCLHKVERQVNRDLVPEEGEKKRRRETEGPCSGTFFLPLTTHHWKWPSKLWNGQWQRRRRRTT